MKLYHCNDARSLRPLWAIEEMELPCEVEVLPFPLRVLRKEHLGTDPLVTLPCLVDGETRMTKPCAICQYVVECRDRPAF